MEKRYVFRADASPDVGAGHVMRVSAIAEELLERGLKVSLVGEISGIHWLEKRVESMCQGLQFISEETFTPNPLSDVLIIDSYNIAIDSPFLESEKWLQMAALIEIGTPKYKADLFMHCGTNPTIQKDYLIGNSQFIGGVKYLPIRKAIRDISYKHNINMDSKTTQILVVGGGTDPFGFVRSLAKQLSKFDSKFQATLISNDSNITKLLDERFVQKNAGNDLEGELKSTDLILTLAGTSSWDFLSCGIPIGIAVGFDNQKDNFEFQKSNKIAVDIGRYTDNGEFDFHVENISKLLNNLEIRQELAKRASEIVDKLGVVRIADELVKLSSKN